MMAMPRLRGLWPVVLSILAHGALLAALLAVLDRARVFRVGPDGPHLAAVVPTPLAEADPSPSEPLEREVSPPDPVPDPSPAVPTARAELALEPLGDLAEARASDTPWRVEDVPLEAARRSLRRPRSQVAPPRPRATPSTPRPPSPASEPDLVPVYTPQYFPLEADRLGLSGRVRVRVTVHTSGAVIDARVVGSSGYPILDDAALASARQWRFAPIAREVRVEIPFHFVHDGR